MNAFLKFVNIYRRVLSIDNLQIGLKFETILLAFENFPFFYKH